MSPRGTSRSSYARAIERMWSALHDRPVVLSERDFARILDWYERRVPLALVREAIAESESRGRGGKRPPRSLAYLARLVEEGIAAIRQGRTMPQGRAGWRENPRER